VGTSPAIGAGHLTTVTVTLADTGCRVSPSSFPGGPVTFRVINPGNTRVSEAEFRDQSGEKILGESEDVEPGAPESFSLLVAAGTYEMSCPGAGGPATKVTVTREQ
jgi:iron uptake system component EfeO